MKIYTTYFSKLKDLSPDVVPIAISRTIPGFFKGVWFQSLAPSWDILSQYKNIGNEDLFTMRYLKENLEMQNMKKLYHDLYILSKGHDVALVCWEKSGTFCHRRIIAEKLEDELGIEVKEW